MPKIQKDCISVREAARRMGCGDALVQAGLISKQLPFGQAIKLPSGRRRYIISRAAFERWLERPSGI